MTSIFLLVLLYAFLYETDANGENSRLNSEGRIFDTLTVSEAVTSSGNKKYHVEATFTPLLKSDRYVVSEPCSTDSGDMGVEASLTVKQEGRKLLYKLGIHLKNTGTKAMESCVANCVVTTNTGQKLNMKLNLKALPD